MGGPLRRNQRFFGESLLVLDVLVRRSPEIRDLSAEIRGALLDQSRRLLRLSGARQVGGGMRKNGSGCPARMRQRILAAIGLLIDARQLVEDIGHTRMVGAEARLHDRERMLVETFRLGMLALALSYLGNIIE